VLLAVISHMVDAQQDEKLQAFLDSQPEALSIPFISWLADMEAVAQGEEKQVSCRPAQTVPAARAPCATVRAMEHSMV
jgi:hypothetical protein